MGPVVVAEGVKLQAGSGDGMPSVRGHPRASVVPETSRSSPSRYTKCWGLPGPGKTSGSALSWGGAKPKPSAPFDHHKPSEVKGTLVKLREPKSAPV